MGRDGEDVDALVAAIADAGADPDARDKGGVAPLHRAVRNRCAAAVAALLAGGADPQAVNGNGSDALLPATRATGRGGSGSAEARAGQAEILRLLEAARRASGCIGCDAHRAVPG